MVELRRWQRGREGATGSFRIATKTTAAVSNIVGTFNGSNLASSQVRLGVDSNTPVLATAPFAIRAASDRREVARHGELLAAEVTARLCGTIPAGAIVGVLTQAFDPTVGLIGASPEEMAAALERQVRGTEDGDAAAIAASVSLVPPRFEPVLHLRKRYN